MDQSCTLTSTTPFLLVVSLSLLISGMFDLSILKRKKQSEPLRNKSCSVIKIITEIPLEPGQLHKYSRVGSCTLPILLN